MRKLIVNNIISLDGFYEGPGRDVMALPMDPAFDAYNLERLRAADTLLLGRSTYDGFRRHWPPVKDDPGASGDNREISRLQGEVEKVVVSDGLTAEQTDPWRDITRIVRRADAHDAIAELKRGEGGEILMFGSRTLWNDLLPAGLVDELHLWVGAKVLGDGTPAFAAPPPAALRLLDARTQDGTSNVLVRYAVG